MMSGNRFVAYKPFDDEMPNWDVVVADLGWWIDYCDQVNMWLATNIPDSADIQSGMVLSFKREKDCSQFLLRWA